jgi:hypothetical protein
VQSQSPEPNRRAVRSRTQASDIRRECRPRRRSHANGRKTSWRVAPVFPALTLPWLAPAVNLEMPGGCLAGFGVPPRRTQAPSAVVLVLRWNARATNRIGQAQSSALRSRP